MDGDRSLWLARALRNATRHTDALFGNDVRTAYQLLARVLLHESSQQGFELAATQDADFHEVGRRRAESPARPGVSWTGGPGSVVEGHLARCPQGKTALFRREPRPVQ